MVNNLLLVILVTIAAMNAFVASLLTSQDPVQILTHIPSSHDLVRASHAAQILPIVAMLTMWVALQVSRWLLPSERKNKLQRMLFPLVVAGSVGTTGRMGSSHLSSTSGYIDSPQPMLAVPATSAPSLDRPGDEL